MLRCTNLVARARQAMIDAGFEPDFPADVANELANATAESGTPEPVRDLQHLLWSSIDNDDSQDLDQLEYLEDTPDGTRLFIGIADVVSRVDRGSLIEAHASFNTTSVYTGIATFPMLPEQLSTGLTSLLPDQPRLAWVVELRVDQGNPRLETISRALVRNHARLTYNAIGAWLAAAGPAPAEMAATAGLEQQLRSQLRVAAELAQVRQTSGAMRFERIEPRPVIRENRVVDLRVEGPNPARQLIESFMVATNSAVAAYLGQKQTLLLRRIVRKPKRWDRIRELARRAGGVLPPAPDSRALASFLETARRRDPLHFPDLSLAVVKLMGRGEYVVDAPGSEGEGHFGLGIRDYTHATAPNRRFADLVTQRLLEAALGQLRNPYTLPQLQAIAARCTEREKAASKVERLMRKVAAADLLGSKIGEIFEGLVTGASPKGTWVRLFHWPAEGKVIRGEAGLDVGDRVKVRLTAVDRTRGFIDFEKVA